MSWLGDHPEVGWIVFALLLGGLEIVTLDLTFAMLAVGALAGAAAGALGAGLLVQVLAAAAVSIAMLGVVRPVALRHE